MPAPALRYILAPYLATPPEVVARMVQLADVQATDCVYDLGCGDGRLLIEAARARGAAGVGVDIEPYWVEQSRLNASQAGVAGLTRFEVQDALEVELASATVVFLYLVQWSTQRVLERLLRCCAPGTRIVSHSFGFATVLESTTEVFIDHAGNSRSLHRCVIPDARTAGSPSQLPSR
jgi:SAM-dependent methyltransferase